MAPSVPPPSAPGPPPRLGLGATLSLVVASMVGTGVFTTTGLLVDDIPSAPGLLLCWAVAGLASLAGALCYAELGTAMPQSGGEYRFLSVLVHPALGFLSAFVSLVVGFAAPLAALALAFGSYLAAVVPDVPASVSAPVLVVGASALNAWRVSAGARVHAGLTVLKVGAIIGLIGAGMALGDPAGLDRGDSLSDVVATPGFALGLVYVSFSYTGWNAAAYVTGEVRDPARTLPRALVAGTALTTVIYVALNAAFLMATPLDTLRGREDVGHVAATALFGTMGGKLMSLIIAVGLVSTVGALVVTGPRVYEAVGRSYPALRLLARRRGREGGPAHAIALQASLALVFMAGASLRELLGYIGFTLSVFSALTVGSLFVLRRQGTVAPFRTWGYPFTPLVFLALMGWMVGSAVWVTPWVLAGAAATCVVGLVLHRLTTAMARDVARG
ncbi:MAG: amino acid permease [Myxococcota bacterium]